MFMLALALGMTVGEIEERMTARELTEWMAYYRIDPFDRQRADMGVGIIASTIANANRAKGSRPLRPIEFVPNYSGEHRPTQLQSTEHARQVFAAAKAGFQRVRERRQHG